MSDEALLQYFGFIVCWLASSVTIASCLAAASGNEPTTIMQLSILVCAGWRAARLHGIVSIRLPAGQDGRLKVAPELARCAQHAGVGEGHHRIELRKPHLSRALSAVGTTRGCTLHALLARMLASSKLDRPGGSQRHVAERGSLGERWSCTSSRWFCIGVPLSRTRRRHARLSSACARVRRL